MTEAQENELVYQVQPEECPLKNGVHERSPNSICEMCYLKGKQAGLRDAIVHAGGFGEAEE